jgi:hypothetical protein
MPFSTEYANHILLETLIDNDAYASLHSGVPTLANELVGLSYRRQLTTWAEPTSGYTTNATAVEFGPLAANPLGAQYFAIWDAVQEGTCVYFHWLPQGGEEPIPINTNDTIDWAIGEITISIQGG